MDPVTQRLTLRPRARIIRTIGDKLISGPVTAVLELVKNAYDADATEVTVKLTSGANGGKIESLRISDNGHGMTPEIVATVWMEPATESKEKQSVSKVFQRPVLGSKGIGRYSCAKLGRHLHLETTSLDGRTSTIPDIDWDVFSSGKYLDEVDFLLHVNKSGYAAGTSLTVRSVSDRWDKGQIEEMVNELRRLITPIRKDASGFAIKLDLSEWTQTTAEGKVTGDSLLSALLGIGSPEEANGARIIQPFPLLTACDYEVNGIFDSNGAFTGTFSIHRHPQQTIQVSLDAPQDAESECGIVDVRLFIFDRERDAVLTSVRRAQMSDSITLKDARRLLDKMMGVAIYRRDFRIRPYGEADYDWLQLDAKRVQNPSFNIGNNQVAGYVLIEDEASSGLVERSSREGLEINDGYIALQRNMSRLFSEIVSPRRYEFRKQLRDVVPEKSYPQLKNSLKLEWATQIAEKLPDAAREDALKTIELQRESLLKVVAEYEERSARLESAITMGRLIGEVLHEGKAPVSFIEREVARIRKWWPELFEENEQSQEYRNLTAELVPSIQYHAIRLREMFDSLAPLSGAKRGNPREYQIEAAVSRSAKLYRRLLNEHKITINIACATDNVRRPIGHEADLMTAINNLIDNSIHWITAIEPEEGRHISISSEYSSGKILINYRDSGPGIGEDFLESVFDPGFTTKSNGHGYGLSIARAAIERENGTIAALPSDSGAHFVISLPAP